MDPLHNPVQHLRADLNGDGKPDLIFCLPAYASGMDDSLVVAMNTSTPGNFSFSAQYMDLGTSMGFNVKTTALGNLDSEGKPDIVAGGVNTAFNNHMVAITNVSSGGSIAFAPRHL